MKKAIIFFLFCILFVNGCGREKYSFPWNFEDYSSKEKLNSSAEIYTGLYNGTQYNIVEIKVNGIYRYEVMDTKGNYIAGEKKQKIIDDFDGYLTHWTKQNVSYNI